MHIKRHEYVHGFQKYDVKGRIYAFTRKYPIWLFDTIIETIEKQKGIPYNPTIVFGVRDGRQN